MARNLVCSFCSKSEHQVAKLVAGPNVFICDECVGIAARIMHDADGPPSGLWRRIASRARASLGNLRRGLHRRAAAQA
jgi:hypothetical protein